MAKAEFTLPKGNKNSSLSPSLFSFHCCLLNFMKEMRSYSDKFVLNDFLDSDFNSTPNLVSYEIIYLFSVRSHKSTVYICNLELSKSTF